MVLTLSLFLIACWSDPVPTEQAPSGARPDRKKAPQAREAARGQTPTWFQRHTTLSTRVPSVDKYGRPTGKRLEGRGGEAIGVMDVDGDRDQDIVLVNGSDYYIVARNQAGRSGPRFEVAHFPVGLEDDEVSNRAKGLSTHDLNDDGRLDLHLATQGGGGVVSYKRDPPNDRGLFRAGTFSTHLAVGDGTYRHVDLGIDGDGSKRSALFGDLDRDGYVDAYISGSSYYGIWYSGSGARNQLFAGHAEGFGPDILPTAFQGQMQGFWVNERGDSVKNFKAALLRDIDGDGLPDILTGSIADIWANFEQELCDPDEYGFQGDWVRGLYLLHNRSEPGNIRLADVSHQAMDNPNGTAGQGHVHSIVALDFDHDGDLDLVVSGNKGRLSHNTLEHNAPILRTFRNDSVPGRPRLVETTATSGVAPMNLAEGLPAPYPIRTRAFNTDLILYPALMAAAPGDFDNDGHMDVVLVDRQTFTHDPVTGESYNLHAFVLRGLGDGRFEPVPAEEHGLVGTARDLSIGDFDADGRLDLVFVDGSTGGQHTTDANPVFLNRGPSDRHWTWIRVAEPGNQMGTGTVVTLRSGGQIVGHDELRTDFNYRSKRDAALHFGLGEVAGFDAHLRFRDGTVAVVPGLQADAQVRILRVEAASEEGRLGMSGPGLDEKTLAACSVTVDGAPATATVADLDGDGAPELVLDGVHAGATVVALLPDRRRALIAVAP